MSQLAAQLYTLREYTKTPADVAKTFARVKKLGYDAVQVSGMGPIDANELNTILKNEGLTCCATHIGRDLMEKETQKVIDDHKLWGCEYTAIGGFFPKDGGTPEDWREFVTSYNALAKKFAGSGLTLGYHNHSHELVHQDGKPILKMLIETLDPSVWFEIDTYWITHGGGDPVQWINYCKGKIPCVHLKDMLINGKREQFMAEVGEGNLNFPAILAACKALNVKWYIVEQDTCDRDPFESLGISLKNLKAMGMS